MLIIDKETGTHSSDTVASIVVLLDASGSMGPNRESVISTFNEYVAKVRASGAPAAITLYTFDSMGLVQVFRERRGLNIPPLTHENYKPDAMTPLYDAIGTVLNRHPGNFVQFVIHTDGLENASMEFNLGQLNALIAARNAAGCQFTWLGEGPDGWNAVKKFEGGTKFAFSAASRVATMGAVAGNSVSYSTTRTKSPEEDIDMDKKQ